MEEKIKNSLNIIPNIKFDIWYDKDIKSGIITLYRCCVTSSILELINSVAELVAIFAVSHDCYQITFMSK